MLTIEIVLMIEGVNKGITCSSTDLSEFSTLSKVTANCCSTRPTASGAHSTSRVMELKIGGGGFNGWIRGGGGCGDRGGEGEIGGELIGCVSGAHSTSRVMELRKGVGGREHAVVVERAGYS